MFSGKVLTMNLHFGWGLGQELLDIVKSGTRYDIFVHSQILPSSFLVHVVMLLTSGGQCVRDITCRPSLSHRCKHTSSSSHSLHELVSESKVVRRSRLELKYASPCRESPFKSLIRKQSAVCDKVGLGDS